jgi:internalin A
MSTPDLTPAQAETIARARIEKNAVSQETWLDLGDLPLACLPDSLGKLGHLQTLSLGNIVLRDGGQGEWDSDRPAKEFTELGVLAELTNLSTLYLGGCKQLRDVSALARLTNLSTLYLGGCSQLSDVSALAGLRDLSTLDLSWCRRLSNVSALAGLTNLSTLNLSLCEQLIDVSALGRLTNLSSLDLRWCKEVKDIEPVLSVLDGLERLYLHECHFDNFPQHLCGEDFAENVVDLVRQHERSVITQGRDEDRECKLLVVGNGAAGKTSLVCWFLERPHPEKHDPTHAIHIEEWNTPIRLTGDEEKSAVRINVWDFAGQELYHETHRLFYQSGAVYLVLWDPWESKRPASPARKGPPDKKRPLQYWIDQIVSADPSAPILIVRSKADLNDDPDPDWKSLLPNYEAIDKHQIDFVKLSVTDSTWTGREARAKLLNWLGGAVKKVLGRPRKRAVGKGRKAVKNEVRAWQAENEETVKANEAAEASGNLLRQELPYPFVTREFFDTRVREHCAGSPDAEDTTPVLKWLHRTGVVFWDERGRFGDRILVDQRWAIQGIYTLLNCERTWDKLALTRGKFTPTELAEWVWNDAGYEPDHQRLFLRFMESCGLCFQLLKEEETVSRQAVYVALEALPEKDSASEDDLRDLYRQAKLAPQPVARAQVEDHLLHNGVAKALLNRIGSFWRRSAVLWKWGAAFVSGDPGVRAGAEVTWQESNGSRSEFGGRLEVAVCGPDGPGFLERILQSIHDLPRFPSGAEFLLDEESRSRALADRLLVTRPPRQRLEGINSDHPPQTTAMKRYLSISLATGSGTRPNERRFQDLVAEKLREQAAAAEYRLLQYPYNLEDPAKTTTDRMQEIALGDLVLIFLSEPYLRNAFCLSELMLTYLQGPPGTFPSQARIWMCPSAREFLTPQPGRAVVPFQDYWMKQLVSTAHPEVSRQLFGFIRDEPTWAAFLTALVASARELSLMPGGISSEEAVNSCVEEVTREINRQLTGPFSFQGQQPGTADEVPQEPRNTLNPKLHRKVMRLLERERHKGRYWLEVFVTVGRWGSNFRASKKLNTTASNVTRILEKLQEQLPEKLLEDAENNRPSRERFTPTAWELYEWAKQVLAQGDQAITSPTSLVNPPFKE